MPRRLLAPPPGWTAATDVVVVGSGIAGLTVARRLAVAGVRVLVVTKDVLAAGSTRWAQGGIAAALGADDSPQAHLADTLAAGGGLADPVAVRVLVEEGPAAVRHLLDLGARLDRAGDGGLALTREGGHRRDRIVHAGGDATGAEVQRALVAAVLAEPVVEVLEHALVLDLLPAPGGGVAGVTLHVLGEGRGDGVGAVRARAVVLATGGLGQIYASTTNPVVSTGDGLAVALRAGAVLRDLEFVQFHPTVLWRGAAARGQQPLVSEAVRGEGATLVDDAGVRFLQGEHELAELAPRDVVAQACFRRMRETGAEHVWLDARHLGAERWRVRFPTIYASCLEQGVDPAHDLVPVVPASHYASGGVRTDRHGRTGVPGLYACGEVACTGVHGANRLASNSLLEGLVFARRIADVLRTEFTDGRIGPAPEPAADPRPAGLVDAAGVPSLRGAMSRGAGVLRSGPGLAATAATLAELLSAPSATPCVETWEATNMLTVAHVLVAAAAAREETRGAHWREDFPRSDPRWAVHLDATLGPDGLVRWAGAPPC